MNLALRPIEASDQAFLFELYASTRAGELSVVAWSPEQKRAFLEHQFQAQQHAYFEGYEGASFQVIVVDSQPAGRLYVARWPSEIRIVDIALLPEYRNQGIGSRLIGDIQAEGAAVGQAVTIHVERFNPARHLYERLGFELAAERDAVYLLMRWQPGAPEVS